MIVPLIVVLAVVGIEAMALSHGINGAVLKSAFVVLGGVAVHGYYRPVVKKLKREAKDNGTL